MNSYNVDNFMGLLLALVNQDEVDNDKIVSKHGVIAVYDTQDNEKLIALFDNAVNCAKLFNTSRECINDNICRGNLRQGRYRIERVII